ncbi:MAG: helix-turn-helix domain-containing protein [Syntrophomonas sp.]
MSQFQVWYRLPKGKKVECRIVEAEDRFDVQKQILGIDPNVTIGLVAPLGEPELEEDRDFLKALIALADSATQLSAAVNEVLRTWPRTHNIPGELQELMGRINNWIDSQPGQSSATVGRKLGINWDELPITLTVQEVANVLRIGKQQVYQLCHGYMYDFPCVRVGDRRFVIPREGLRTWFESACQEGTFQVKKRSS